MSLWTRIVQFFQRKPPPPDEAQIFRDVLADAERSVVDVTVLPVLDPDAVLFVGGDTIGGPLDRRDVVIIDEIGPFPENFLDRIPEATKLAARQVFRGPRGGNFLKLVERDPSLVGWIQAVQWNPGRWLCPEKHGQPIYSDKAFLQRLKSGEIDNSKLLGPGSLPTVPKREDCVVCHEQLVWTESPLSLVLAPDGPPADIKEERLPVTWREDIVRKCLPEHVSTRSFRRIQFKRREDYENVFIGHIVPGDVETLLGTPVYVQSVPAGYLPTIEELVLLPEKSHA